MGGSGDSRLLKILHIDPERNWGGGEAQVFGLLTYLAGQGTSQRAFGPSERARCLQRCQELNLTIPSVRRCAMILDLARVPALRRLIRTEELRHRPLSYQAGPRSVALAAAHAKLVPSTSSPAEWTIRNRVVGIRHWLYNKRVDGVVAISQAIGDLLAQAGVDRQRFAEYRAASIRSDSTMIARGGRVKPTVKT